MQRGASFLFLGLQRVSERLDLIETQFGKESRTLADVGGS